MGRILGDDLAPNLTILIGISEIIMAGWVLSRYRSRLNAIIQIALVLLMNIIESLLAHDLLFWGRSNGFFAFIFIAVIYYNEFVLHKNTSF